MHIKLMFHSNTILQSQGTKLTSEHIIYSAYTVTIKAKLCPQSGCHTDSNC